MVKTTGSILPSTGLYSKAFQLLPVFRLLVQVTHGQAIAHVAIKVFFAA